MEGMLQVPAHCMCDREKDAAAASTWTREGAAEVDALLLISFFSQDQRDLKHFETVVTLKTASFE